MSYRVLILTLLLSGSLAANAMADDKKGWKIMGQTVVSEGTDRTQIAVNAKKGTFRQVKVQVQKAPVGIQRMILHFEDNEKQVVWLTDYEEGAWSRPINVKGGKRVITRAVFWYSNTATGDEKAIVYLWGRQ